MNLTSKGRFLYETLAILAHWKSDPAIYAKECGSLPGFSKSFVNPQSETASYEEFVKVSFKWHCTMAKVRMVNFFTHPQVFCSVPQFQRVHGDSKCFDCPNQAG